MAEVEISREAQTDLADIGAAGVEQFGSSVAERHLRDLRRVFGRLADYPLAGQARPEFRHGIRSVPCRPHRILYTVRGDTVLIVRVIHQARDVARALGDQ